MGSASRLANEALRAVHSRLETLAKAGELPEVRTVHKRFAVSFHSATLAPNEISYDARERETLGIIRACQRFRPYIHGCKGLLIENDHHSLSYLYTGDHSGRLFRWLWQLQEFAPYLILHVPGQYQHVPDGLSRYYSTFYDTKHLAESIYGAEQVTLPPPTEVLQTLDRHLPLQNTSLYDPIVCHPETTLRWQELGRTMIPVSKDSNYFDRSQRLGPDQYDAIVTTGPYPDIGGLVTAFKEQPKPWAMLIDTQVLTRPDSGLDSVPGLQVIPIVTYREFSQRNKRNLPYHKIWVGQRLDAAGAVDCVALPNLIEPPTSNIG